MKLKAIFASTLLLVTVSLFTYYLKPKTINPVHAQTQENPWPMAGANPQRTSWTPEEVRGQLQPLWYKPIEPYIPPKVQIIAANNTLYVSTARGLYAIDSETGETKWVYPTEMPLGHSPTIDLTTNIAYVGGFDHRIHAIEGSPDTSSLPTDSTTGQRVNNRLLWTFEAEAGFDTNPLVVSNVLYAGNRDGYMYALDLSDPTNSSKQRLLWKYKTNGPIHFSAAYNSGAIYFASNDSHAYALNATTGTLVWKSQKLPGAGFHSWWPVVYNAPSGEQVVVFGGSNNYRTGLEPGLGWGWQAEYDLADVYPNNRTDPRGTPVCHASPETNVPGSWAVGTVTLNVSCISEYLEQPSLSEQQTDPSGLSRSVHKPWRRTVFVLNQSNGQEYTFDSDSDSQQEYTPILWTGTHSGNRYPAVIGSDQVIYQQSSYLSAPYIPGGHISGWKIGTPFISVVSADWGAIDEPHAYSAGGNLIYWSLASGREAGAFDIKMPDTRLFNSNPPGYLSPDSSREWSYYAYNLDQLFPGYDTMYGGDYFQVYGGQNGVYEEGGDQNPPIPYKGRLYLHRSNSILVLGAQTQADPLGKTVAQTISTSSAFSPQDVSLLKQRLELAVQKIIDSGHLRPGFMSTGIFDVCAKQGIGDNLVDYFHNPADTLYTLLLGLPHLSSGLQNQVRTFLQNEFINYPPNQYSHIGWRDGTARETFTLPPEVDSDLANSPKGSGYSYGFPGWGAVRQGGTNIPPHTFYVLWKYAKEFGDAKSIFDNSKNVLSQEPTDPTIFQKYPFVVNSFIAGYIGYLELEKLAGYSESTDIRTKLNNLLAYRVTNFSKDNTFNDACGPDDYNQAISVSRNFLFLVPELADYLNQNGLNKVQEAMNEYQNIAPYWFVARFEATVGEGVFQHLYDVNSLFQAKAQILKEPYEELVKYLDIPASETGDLFYIQNLVSAIEAQASSPTPTPNPCTLTGDLNCDGKVNASDLVTLLSSFGKTSQTSDLNGDGKVNASDLVMLLANFGASTN